MSARSTSLCDGTGFDYMRKWGREPGGNRNPPGRRGLLDIARPLLAVALAGEGFLGTAFFPGFQVEGMTLDLFDNVFLLHLALKSTKRALQSFAVLDDYFSQPRLTSLALLSENTTAAR